MALCSKFQRDDQRVCVCVRGCVQNFDSLNKELEEAQWSLANTRLEPDINTVVSEWVSE